MGNGTRVSIAGSRVARSIFCGMLIAFACLVNSCNHIFYQPDDAEYLRVEDVAFPSSRFFIASGQAQLAAWTADPYKGKPRALVVQVHGNAQNMTAHFASLAYFLRQGFRVLSFDYQGYGITDGVPTRDNTVADTAAVIRYVRRRWPELPLIVFGQSLGGAIAVGAIGSENLQSEIKLLILDSTFASYRGIARSKLAMLWLTWPLQYPLSFLVSDNLSPTDYAADFSIPILQIHAKSDPVVPYAQGEELYASFTGSRQKVFVSYEGVTHTAGFNLPVSSVIAAFNAQLSKAGIP